MRENYGMKRGRVADRQHSGCPAVTVRRFCYDSPYTVGKLAFMKGLVPFRMGFCATGALESHRCKPYF